MNILLTGATGFIGSHIAEFLVNKNHTIYATCRKSSDFKKCATFYEKVEWLNQDIDDWQQNVEHIELDLLIHTAWSGVSASQRNDWDIQLINFEFSKKIIEFSLQLNVKKIICLGSQAEYGLFDSKVTENETPYPIDAYGAIKLLTLYYLSNIADKQLINWYWLRVFSVIGQNENDSWLLPQVMSKLLLGSEIELTEGKQCYDYLYIDDFLSRLNLVIEASNNISGVYNICSGRSVEIKEMLILVAEKLNISSSKLLFGKIPYRENQNMFIVGSPDKFESGFGKLSFESLAETVSKITNYYQTKY
jgi:nucleoside-diphosphate-sugar epimerase